MTDQAKSTITPVHLGLGQLIGRLAAVPDPDRRVPIGFGNPHSYRGDYWDLAFEIAHDVRIGDMLVAARAALGATFQGWKGGDFTMREHTATWLVLEEGDCGESIGAVLLELLLAPTAAAYCCDLHGRNCEQGGEECCARCTEAHHFAPGHGGVTCSSPAFSPAGPASGDVDAAYERGLAEGRRQATEGWGCDEQWTLEFRCNGGDLLNGYDYGGWIFGSPDEALASVDAWGRDFPQLKYTDVRPLRRVSLVGPWEPAEQTEATPTQHCGNDVYVHEPHVWLSLSDDGTTVAKRSCAGTGPASGGVVEPSPLTAEEAPGLTELLDTEEEIEADAIRTARLPENPPGVGARLARDEEIQRRVEQAEGSDR